MTKEELKLRLKKGTVPEEIFEFEQGQECYIFKADWAMSKDDDIVYIPDLDLNELVTDRSLNDEEIENFLEHCCTKKRFLDEANGNEKVAEAIFDFCDWQHPDVQDLRGITDDDEAKEIYGISWTELFGE